MKLKKKTATTYTNVVSLAEAKAHLRVDTSTDDTLITSLINTAGEIVEQYTGLFLEQCDFTYLADTFQHIMNVHAGPGVRIDSVKYQSDAGTLEAWSSTNYFTDVDSYPMRVDFEHIPSDVDERVHAVQISGRAGYTTVPSALKSAMLLIIGHLYEHRKDVLVGIQSAPLVHGAKYLMDKFKPSTF